LQSSFWIFETGTETTQPSISLPMKFSALFFKVSKYLIETSSGVNCLISGSGSSSSFSSSYGGYISML